MLFVHIPKTAGTTFGTILKKQYSRQDLCELYVSWDSANGELEMLSSRGRCSALFGHFSYGIHSKPEVQTCLWDDVQYATFLRDPVARVVSHFNHVMNSDDPTHREVVANFPTLERFLQHCWARNLQTHMITGWDFHKIEREPEAAVRTAINIMRDRFKVVGVTERFDESLVLFAREFGYRIPMYVPTNLALSRKWRLRIEDLDGSLIARIRDVNRCDFSIYEHAVSVNRAKLSEDPWLRLRLREYRARLAGYRFLRKRCAALKHFLERCLSARFPGQRQFEPTTQSGDCPHSGSVAKHQG